MSIRNEELLAEIDLAKFKGILIDIDDTLYSYQPNHDRAIRDCYEYCKANETFEESFEVFNTHYRECRDRITNSLIPLSACRSRALAFDLLFTEFNFDFPYKKAIEYEALYWKSFINKIEPHQYIIDFLEKCQSLEKIVCAVTDMQYLFQSMKLEKMNTLGLINFLATSEEAGREKPHIEIFNLALSKMKLKANDVIMIGDSYKKDILGARNAGIESVHLQV